MPNTAKRRWSRELDFLVDGISIGPDGPMLVHGYDEPAGGKWVDEVIPGKLGAFDRANGELAWVVPCEVGYGRGFGAGPCGPGKVLILGPSNAGHRVVCQSLADGEVQSLQGIESFDVAQVSPGAVVCLSAGRVFGLDPETLTPTWSYARKGERYHHLQLLGDLAMVAYSTDAGHGVLRLDAETGSVDGVLLSPAGPLIRGLAGCDDTLVLLTSGVDRLIDQDRLGAYAEALVMHPDGGDSDTLSMVAFQANAEPGTPPLWFRILETQRLGDLPPASISADSGKLYLERGAVLEAVDLLTGRPLGEWTVPGLDEQVAWQVVAGAGLLAEETRISVFELPA